MTLAVALCATGGWTDLVGATDAAAAASRLISARGGADEAEDDLGLRPPSGEEPLDLYEIIRQRYERGSTTVTSDRDVEEIPALFHDALLASAAMDRLLHHAHVFRLDGDTYRNPPPNRARRNGAAKEAPSCAARPTRTPSGPTRSATSSTRDPRATNHASTSRAHTTRRRSALDGTAWLRPATSPIPPAHDGPPSTPHWKRLHLISSHLISARARWRAMGVASGCV
ncbi:MAG: ATP-binding protein [Deltaproteobacteria bacterium]|nr:ATP-binding protein [Deltaproteobacteria bacterium]